MERQERFAADLDAASDTGVAGPSHRRPRHQWQSKAVDSEFDTHSRLVHEQFAVAVGQILTWKVEAGFTPCAAVPSVSGITASFRAGHATVARLQMSAGITDRLMASRFGGAAAMAEPVVCAASRLVAMPLFDQLAEVFHDLWQSAGINLSLGGDGDDRFVGRPYDYALRFDCGEVRVAYAAGFAEQPESRGTGFSPTGLDGTMVRLTAVVAQPKLDLRAFAALGEGSTIPLGRCDGILLMAGASAIATGTLVGFGTQRGVKLSGFAGQPQ